MKRRLICLVLTFAMLIPSTLISASAASTDMPQGIQVFAGLRDTTSPGWNYETYTDSDIAQLLTATNEFVINVINEPYNYDMDGNEIISAEDIAGISASNVHASSELQNIINTYQAYRLEHYNSSSSACNLQVLADAEITLANRIVAQDSNAKIWISFPFIAFFPIAEQYAEPFTEYAEYIKAQMTQAGTWNNVRGFYWATESIGWSGKFDLNNSTHFNNPHVKLLNTMANLVKNTYGKQFMWMPYTENSTTTNLYANDTRMGYVANRTTIFNYVLLQPTYYFYSANLEPFRRVKACVTNNKVYYPVANSSYNTVYSNVVGTSRVSGAAKIGIVMELDSNIVGSDSTYNDRYYTYTSTYGSLKTSVPVIFYTGARPSTMNSTVFNYMKNFLNY